MDDDHPYAPSFTWICTMMNFLHPVIISIAYKLNPKNEKHFGEKHEWRNQEREPKTNKMRLFNIYE